MLKVLTVFGTRPEAIKMAPVVKELERHPKAIQSIVCVTGQHREMLDQPLSLFGIKPDIDLALMREQQDLTSLTARALTALSEVVRERRPDVVLVQGDTTTAMTGALAGFYHKVPVGHVEAGLRTGNPYSPFPEEINRRIVGVITTHHFAPTETAAAALRREGVSPAGIHVTGNTVIDALHWMVKKAPPAGDTVPGGLERGQRLVLVTAHRRENLGQPLENICQAIQDIVRQNPDVVVVYPVHLNPAVSGPAHRLLGKEPRVRLIEPLPYEPFVHLMHQAHLVLTDSGGLQEEAPALGKPVLVLRAETERPEAVEAGTVKLVGTERETIVREAQRLLRDPAEYRRMATAVSPYGDGKAAGRIVSVLLGRDAAAP